MQGKICIILHILRTQPHSIIPYYTMLSKYGQFTRTFKNIQEANLIFFRLGITTTLKKCKLLRFDPEA